MRCVRKALPALLSLWGSGVWGLEEGRHSVWRRGLRFHACQFRQVWIRTDLRRSGRGCLLRELVACCSKQQELFARSLLMHRQVQGVLRSMTQLFADPKLPLIYISQAHTCLARWCFSGSGRELCQLTCPRCLSSRMGNYKSSSGFQTAQAAIYPAPARLQSIHTVTPAPNPRVQLNELRRYTTGAVQRSYQSSPITPFPSRPDDNLPQT
jgi:predicted RNA-binding protein YlxR (DUF448 family)